MVHEFSFVRGWAQAVRGFAQLAEPLEGFSCEGNVIKIYVIFLLLDDFSRIGDGNQWLLERGEYLEQEKKPLFTEEDQVEIHFLKPSGTVSFKRNIASPTVDAAVKALAALVSHLAELVNVHPGNVLAAMAAVLLTPEDNNEEDT